MADPLKYIRIDPFQYSFGVLGLYTQSQKALFARTRSDVDCIRLLREQATADVEHFLMLLTKGLFRIPSPLTKTTVQ